MKYDKIFQVYRDNLGNPIKKADGTRFKNRNEAFEFINGIGKYVIHVDHSRKGGVIYSRETPWLQGSVNNTIYGADKQKRFPSVRAATRFLKALKERDGIEIGDPVYVIAPAN